MHPFEEMNALGHEQVVFCRDDATGLRAIIAVHNTALGPSLGGCRLYNYDSEAAALRDVLRLSRGMTYKAAVAGLDLGGGKAVILGDKSIKSEALMRAFGRFVDSLGGRYITAEDMNTNVKDMNMIRRETRWVTGVGAHNGGSGDPSPVTAWGVFNGLKASLKVVYGSGSVEGRKVAIMGVGHVGYYLAKFLHEEGAQLVYNDINTANLDRVMSEFGGEVVQGDDYYSVECDVLAPCAIGGIINEHTIPVLRTPIIAGAANNVLRNEDQDGAALTERGITYAPDYVINAGGLMSVYCELHEYPHDKAMNDATHIFDTVEQVLLRAKAENLTTIEASNRIALQRIESVSRVKRIWTS
ncbi:MAG: leucine dehydrogenase [Kiritimatiellia bacterium]|jgi:leucine dehydrogenase